MPDNSAETHEMAPADTYFRDVRYGVGGLMLVMGVADMYIYAKSGIHIYDDSLNIQPLRESAEGIAAGGFSAWLGHCILRGKNVLNGRSKEQQSSDIHG